jgi:hypothetical protein
MPLSILAILRLLLEGAVEWLKWKALEAEAGLKTLVYDKKKEVDEREITIKDEVRDLHAAGRHNDAERVLNDFLGQQGLAQDLQQRLLEVSKGSNNPNS